MNEFEFEQSIIRIGSVDTIADQVDTRPSSQNSQLEELGQEVDTLSEQIRSTLDPVPRTASLKNWDRRSTHSQSRSTQDTFPEDQAVNFQTSVSTLTPLKHSKEADPVEDFFGEEFEEDPTSQIAEHRLGLQVSQVSSQFKLLQGSTLKNE
ncbi:hypothetical protein Taro_017139, partial [Colocasia esculenta]|nr:hypothetical protein [Colocasia esculenta]